VWNELVLAYLTIVCKKNRRYEQQLGANDPSLRPSPLRKAFGRGERILRQVVLSRYARSNPYNFNYGPHFFDFIPCFQTRKKMKSKRWGQKNEELGRPELSRTALTSTNATLLARRFHPEAQGRTFVGYSYTWV
jgi:hypothetical protein